MLCLSTCYSGEARRYWKHRLVLRMTAKCAAYRYLPSDLEQKENHMSSAPNIIVYSKSHCGQCDATKLVLDRAEVPYTVIDILADPATLPYLQGLGHQAAPVVYVDEQTHWAGFNREKLAEVIKAMTLSYAA